MTMLAIHRRDRVRDPLGCPRCLELGDVCALHEGIGLELDHELPRLLAAALPGALFDDVEHFDV